jgi:hypothetical protein
MEPQSEEKVAHAAIACAIALLLCLVVLFFTSCQSITVQIGDYPSADKATGVRADTSVNKKVEPVEKKP